MGTHLYVFVGASNGGRGGGGGGGACEGGTRETLIQHPKMINLALIPFVYEHIISKIFAVDKQFLNVLYDILLYLFLMSNKTKYF